jgi:4-hydroxy-3-polyprenylbenzoate decarboxylase
MDAPVISRPAKANAAKDRQDLRSWIALLREHGELQDIAGAELEKEIGGIVDIYQRRIGNKSVLFDDIPGHPRGHRILANLLTSIRRINITLGLPADGTPIELVHYWRRYMKEAKVIPPETLKTGPLMENVYTGKDIDIFKIPVPRWHEHDGGYYIGTGDMVIMRDPDSGWINYGAYRVQAQEPGVATVMFSKGKHGDMIKRRYHERGEPCPIAVVCGMHPALFMIAGLEIPYGKNEYDAAGGLIGEPVEVITGPRTGLPIPAHAEIAFEGFIYPDDVLDEGPLGEWTGYYAGGLKKEPAIRIETFMHRDDPILLGAIPGIPPDDDSFYRGTYRSGAVWN